MQKTSENTLNSNFLEDSAPTQEKADVFYLKKMKKHENVFNKHKSKQGKKVIRLKNVEQTDNKKTSSKSVYTRNIQNYESEETTNDNSACSKNIPKHFDLKENIQNQYSTTVDPKCPVDPLNHELSSENEYLSEENNNLYGNTDSLHNESDEPLAAAGETKYLSQTSYCDVNSQTIRSLAASLTRGKTSTMSKAVAIFNYVRDTISYSFYYNTKKGALGTLRTKSANCCDHTHLLIALMRASGIPAKYVHVKARFTSGNWYGHVYANVMVNGKWYSADATSSQNTFGVIKNWSLSSCSLKGIYASLPF